MKTQYVRFLFLSAVLLALIWLPSRAQAQFTFILNPSTLNAPLGTNDLIFSGTLTNSGNTTLASDNDPYFNLLTGPAGQDLTTFPVYLDNFYAPATLAPGQTTSQVFSVNIDPTATLGQYTGNISFGYGDSRWGQGVTIKVAPTPVPEANSGLLLGLGALYLGGVFLRRRAIYPRA